MKPTPAGMLDGKLRNTIAKTPPATANGRLKMVTSMYLALRNVTTSISAMTASDTGTRSDRRSLARLKFWNWPPQTISTPLGISSFDTRSWASVTKPTRSAPTHVGLNDEATLHLLATDLHHGHLVLDVGDVRERDQVSALGRHRQAAEIGGVVDALAADAQHHVEHALTLADDTDRQTRTRHLQDVERRTGRDAETRELVAVGLHPDRGETHGDLAFHVGCTRNLADLADDLLRDVRDDVEVVAEHLDGDVALHTRDEVVDAHLDGLRRGVHLRRHPRVPRSASSSVSFSTVRPGRHSLFGLRMTKTSLDSGPAGSTAPSGRPMRLTCLDLGRLLHGDLGLTRQLDRLWRSSSEGARRRRRTRPRRCAARTRRRCGTGAEHHRGDAERHTERGLRVVQRLVDEGLVGRPCGPYE